MGTSKPPQASVDLVGSFARRRGSDVEIVLAQPKNVAPDASVRLTLTRAGRSIEAPGELSTRTTGLRLIARAPRRALINGRWGLRLHVDNDKGQQLNARLLVQGDRPLALLWGAKNARSCEPGPSRETRRRVAQRAGKLLDRALSVVPEEQGKKIRSHARTTARRVLG